MQELKEHFDHLSHALKHGLKNHIKVVTEYEREIYKPNLAHAVKTIH